MTTNKKTVRREIRDLTGDQWRRVVRAFWTMKKTSDADGKTKYGSSYLSYDTLLKMHMSAALYPNGDQMHFGPQFGPTHRAWLLLFERSMRAIDPLIDGLPYWDFRRESIKTVFTSKYLGSTIGSASEGYAVVDGAFAHWPIARADTVGATVVKGTATNAYGYHRHPLSINSSPYNTRNGGALCGYTMGLGDATMWDTCLTVGNILDWTACVDGSIHGPTHSSVAGSWAQWNNQPQSSNCAQWFGFIPAPNAPSTLLNSPVNRPYQLGSFISPYALGCFACPTCSPHQPPDQVFLLHPYCILPFITYSKH